MLFSPNVQLVVNQPTESIPSHASRCPFKTRTTSTDERLGTIAAVHIARRRQIYRLLAGVLHGEPGSALVLMLAHLILSAFETRTFLSCSAHGANKQHTVARCVFTDDPRHASVVTSEYLSCRCLSCHQPGCSPSDLGLRQSIFTPGRAPGWLLSVAPCGMSHSKSLFSPISLSALH